MEPEKTPEPLDWARFSSRALGLIRSESAFDRLITGMLAIGWLIIGFAVLAMILALASVPLELMLDKPLGISIFEAIPLLVLGGYGVLLVCFSWVCLLLTRIEKHLRKPDQEQKD